jgi:hypothetical protein
VADGNILAIRAYIGGAGTTRWILDEDGDTWQPGSVGLNAVPDAHTGPSSLIIDCAGNDLPCAFFRDSSDVAHGMTTYASTETWGDITKAVSATGGLRLRGFQSTGTGYQAFKLLGFLRDNIDTTRSTAGRAACEVIIGKMTGTTVGDINADANLFGIRKQQTGGAETTVFLVDEDGDTWQSGGMTVEVAASAAAAVALKNDVGHYSVACTGSDEFIVYDVAQSNYIIQAKPDCLYKALFQTTYFAFAQGGTNYFTLNNSGDLTLKGDLTLNVTELTEANLIALLALL